MDNDLNGIFGDIRVGYGAHIHRNCSKNWINSHIQGFKSLNNKDQIKSIKIQFSIPKIPNLLQTTSKQSINSHSNPNFTILPKIPKKNYLHKTQNK